ncbi:hypothetical protein [Thalassotalea sp. G2M2-11]|uniref:hypothetical protein n=1 Tax=Thalassotalea sp. G2M2-11 TaxID=2787627 RepID=UPI0019D315AD|nr:hypothetical protein [Thalassotalea sp. G2M2-11]
MSYSEQQIWQLTEPLRQSLGNNITWSFDERLNMMLSEFAQNKSQQVLSSLRETLIDEWHDKSWKHQPSVLKNALADFAKLKKGQRILALAADQQTPTLVALWWPWDHGGTYSLRIKLIEQSYQVTPEQGSSSGVIAWLKGLFTGF